MHRYAIHLPLSIRPCVDDAVGEAALLAEALPQLQQGVGLPCGAVGGEGREGGVYVVGVEEGDGCDFVVGEGGWVSGRAGRRRRGGGGADEARDQDGEFGAG